jgi:choline dehydrogenase-like flavoprotein
MPESAEEAGIPNFSSLNVEMSEALVGCEPNEIRIHEGKRVTILRSYDSPRMHQPNPAVFTQVKAFAAYLARETPLRKVTGPDISGALRRSASTIWHQSGTAKTGRDAMSVVDGSLRGVWDR